MKPSNMKIQLHDLVIRVPFLSLEAPSSEHSYPYHKMACPFDGTPRKLKKNKVKLVLHRMKKLGKKAYILARGVREHVRLSPKITKTLKGKLTMGARVLQLGGMDKVFMDTFNVGDGERLMKTFQCYLSTSIGPVGGLLFISTKRVAFCSERCIKLVSSAGETTKVHYKVMIPLRKIKMASETENTEKPSQKYIQITTADNFDFWFMGFLNYQKTLKHLGRAISQA